MIHIRKKKTINTFFWHIEFCIGCYTLGNTNGQSWPNYIGPKRDIPQVCLTRPVFTPFFLKVALSGISLITIAAIIIAGEQENIPSWMADWPHCCDFERDTCDGLRCFQNPQNRSKMIYFIASFDRALSSSGIWDGSVFERRRGEGN